VSAYFDPVDPDVLAFFHVQLVIPFEPANFFQSRVKHPQYGALRL
jgi:hypothetical protein